MSQPSSCSACGAAVGNDAFLTTEGQTACRACFYADQTKQQERRIENAQNELGAYGTFALGRRLVVSALFVIFGSWIAVSALLRTEWSTAAVAAAFVGLGVVVGRHTLRSMRRRQQ